MKKSFLACILVMMLTITGCSSKTATQTLFVEKNNKYACSMYFRRRFKNKIHL